MVLVKQNMRILLLPVGKKEGLLIKKGVIIEKLPQEEIVERLKQEILAFEEEHKND